jgi:Ca2+-binding RTX toxin-like protein
VLTTTPGNTLENPAVFNVTATNGSAKNDDYDSGFFPKTITFAVQSGNGAVQVTALEPASDALVETDETVTLGLSLQEGPASIGVQSQHVVVIVDAIRPLPAWQNPANRFDVNDNTTMDPLDALVVINSLNTNGSRQLPIINNSAPYFDVNGDGFVSPGDPLAIINALNALIPPAANPCDPSAVDLIVGGTDANDTITLLPAPAGSVQVLLNGAASGPFAPAGRIVICGRGGNDTIIVDAMVNRSVFIFGGAGNDVIEGGSGDDVLVGGEGNDQLYGGLGRNVLIAGANGNVQPLPTDLNRLLGAIGDNLMIAGFTDFDTQTLSLARILDEWRRPDADYITRVNHLRGVSPGGLNGGITLNRNTVHDNAIRDDLFGCTGQNWYLAHTLAAVPLDTLTGRKTNELIDVL